MSRERLWLPGRIPIETGYDRYNGRWFIGYSKGASQYFTCSKELRRWLKLPLKTASREAFDAWIASLEEADRVKGNSVSVAQDRALLKETGFGPEAFDADEPADPVEGTKMVL